MANNVMIIILSVVVALLAVASAVLGFMAQATKLTPDEIIHESDGVCVYPAKPAHALGICALPLLVAAMVISSVAGCCFGCVKLKPQGGGGGASGSRRLKGIGCCVASWILAAVAMADYVQGVRWNAATTRDAVVVTEFYSWCEYLKGNSFATAAVLTLVAAALGIRSFTMLLTPAPAAGAEPNKHEGGEQPPPVVAAGVSVVGEAPGHQNQPSAASAPPRLPPQGQGQAHALV